MKILGLSSPVVYFICTLTLYGTAIPLYLELLVALGVEEVPDLLVVDLHVGDLDVVLRVAVPLQVLLALEDVHNGPQKAMLIVD